MINNKIFRVFLSATCLGMTLLATAQKKKTRTIEKETTPIEREYSSKEIELKKEIDAPANATVRISVTNQNIEIRRSSNGKVMLTKKIEVDKNNTQTNDELLEKYGINVHALNNRVDITAKENGMNNFFFSGPSDFQKMGSNIHVDKFSFSTNKGNNNPQLFEFKRDQSEMSRNKAKLMKDLSKIKRDQQGLIEKLNKSKSANEKLKKLNEEGFITDQDLKALEELKSMDHMKVWADSIRIMMPKIEIIPRINNQLVEKMNLSKTMNMDNNFNFHFNMQMGNKSNLVVYVPANVKLDIENQFGNINIAEDYKEASINIKNGSLEAKNFGTLKLISKFATVNLGDVNDAEIEFENGNFTASNIKDLDVDSKFSTFELDNCENIIIRSQNDNYNVESVNKLEGRKSFGSFRVNRLNKSFNLDGQNADLKIKNMVPGVEMVKINDRFADVRLPVKDLQNYSVAFSGDFSTVYGPFEKHIVDNPTMDKIQKSEKSSLQITRENGMVYMNGNPHSKNISGDNSPNFNATVGDTKGPHTIFDIKCSNCTVDFK